MEKQIVTNTKTVMKIENDHALEFTQPPCSIPVLERLGSAGCPTLATRKCNLPLRMVFTSTGLIPPSLDKSPDGMTDSPSTYSVDTISNS